MLKILKILNATLGAGEAHPAAGSAGLIKWMMDSRCLCLKTQRKMRITPMEGIINCNNSNNNSQKKVTVNEADSKSCRGRISKLHDSDSLIGSRGNRITPKSVRVEFFEWKLSEESPLRRRCCRCCWNADCVAPSGIYLPPDSIISWIFWRISWWKLADSGFNSSPSWCWVEKRPGWLVSIVASRMDPGAGSSPTLDWH